MTSKHAILRSNLLSLQLLDFEDNTLSTRMDLKLVKIEKPDNLNFLIGQTQYGPNAAFDSSNMFT